MRETTDRLRRCAATFCGLGLLPVMPGTYGSLGAIVVFVLLRRALPHPSHLNLALLALIVAASLITMPLGGWAEKFYGKKDPGPVVLDEVAGQWIALLFLPMGFMPWAIIAASFVLFRILDVLKPWPADALQNVPGGAGILLDDVAAGVYANATIRVFLFVGPLAGLW
ncbi:MAG: phosphatidylglycerophosphatase A family protein [Alphaproteobacteria bacterium]